MTCVCCVECVCVHGATNACVCMYLDVNLRFGSSRAVGLFAKTRSHWLGQAGWPQVPGICLFHFLSNGITRVHNHSQLFNVSSKEQIQVSVFVKKHCID